MVHLQAEVTKLTDSHTYTHTYTHTQMHTHNLPTDLLPIGSHQPDLAHLLDGLPGVTSEHTTASCSPRYEKSGIGRH